MPFRGWVRLVAVTALLLGGTNVFASDSPNGRIRQKLNADWRFARQSSGAGELGSFDRNNETASRVEPRFRSATTTAYDDSSWQSIDLPHTWNAHDVSDERPGYWRGIGWYRKRFRVDTRYVGKKCVLEFEGVNSVAEIWLNGKFLGRHQGGYTGFEFEIMPRFGRVDNVLTVKVDNLYHADVPPTVKTDYSFYGGIYRDVWLRITEPIYLAEVAWNTPSLSQEAGKVELRSRIRNQTSSPRQLTLRQEIFNPQGELVMSVASAAVLKPGQAQELAQTTGTIQNPRLWSPETPNLYRIRTSLRENSHLLDVVETPLGFRWFRFDPQQGFFLNGKRIQIQGTNWHQSYPGMGNALPNSRHLKDMEMIRDMGANFWRTSHYPHDEATLEASDRLGLMVWEELPVNKEIGDPEAYIGNSANMAREMIRRDRNHPSVILWGIAGEINAPKDISRRVVASISKLYRELDPARPVAMHEPRGDEIEALVDVVGLGVSPETDQEHLRNPARCYMVSEHGAGAIGRGLYGMGPASEDAAVIRHENLLRELNRRPWMAGAALWHQFDYDGETYDEVIPHLVSFGMADAWRIPKEVYFFYQSQWSDKPMVHIVGHWTWPGEEGRTREVKIYSNADQVELFLNGQSLGAKRELAESGLRHPPRIWQVPYQPGTLQAVAKAGSQELVDARKTAGPPAAILLDSDTAQLTSGDPESLAYITAQIVDEHGVTVPGSHSAITFTSYGPGKLVEQTWPGYGTGLTWNVVDGKTRIAFRSTSRTGEATISAYSPGFRMGRITINVTAPGKPNEMDYQNRFQTDELP